LALCQFRIREVISDKISTLMNTTLLNNPTKFGAKIFRRYQVITFYVLGHFFKPHPVDTVSSNDLSHKALCKCDLIG